MLLKSVLIGFLSFSILHADMLKECKTEADKISGCVEKEYDSSVNLWRETPYKNGKKEGIEKRYYENGNLALEMPYKNGEAEGMLKGYYENGLLRRDAPLKNDKIDGILKEYYENGSLQAEVKVLNDKLHGDTRFYTEDGKLLALVKGENGKIISGKCFDDKVLTDKEIDDLSGLKSIEEPINYLKEICLKSDSK